MSFNIYILNASKKLTYVETKIKDLILESETILLNLMNFNKLNIDLVVKSGSFFIVPEVGIGAVCNGQYEIIMTLDMNNKNLLNNFNNNFKLTLMHETHHACRISALGFGSTLLDAMVMEGLACHFEVEMGFNPSIYVEQLDPSERQCWFQKAKSEWLNNDYNYNDWFFGNKEQNIPRWLGYSLGYYLTGLYLEETGKKASECFNAPSHSILALLNERDYFSSH